MKLTLDTDTQIFFYEQDYYVLSNFSSFTLVWKGLRFDTSEAAYHWEKFTDYPEIQKQIQESISAHEAYKIAERNKSFRRKDWDDVKVSIMKEILYQKVIQHEYVYRKLLDTGDKELIENSWRDDFWGWGENRDGKNMLGKLWMEIRNEFQEKEIDTIFTYVESCMKMGEWDVLSKIFYGFLNQVEKMPLNICVAYATISFAGKSKIQYRNEFVEKCKIKFPNENLWSGLL